MIIVRGLATMARRGMGRPERVLPVVEMRRTDGSLGRSARARLAREKRAEQERLGVKVEAKPRVWSKQSTSQAKLSEREKLRLKEARRSARLASTNAVVDDTRLAFQHLGLDGSLRSQLTAIGIEKPTAIQTLAIPEIRKGTNVLAAAETGSGKTLMYLLPVIERIRAHKAALPAGTALRLLRPLAIVVVPSKELAGQVYEMCVKIAKPLGVRATLLTTTRDPALLKKSLERPFDIAIGTPLKLISLMENKKLYSTDAQCVVLDEADTLFDETFRHDIDALIGELPERRTGLQFVACSATMSSALKAFVRDRLSNSTVVTTESLHRGLRNIAYRFEHLVGRTGREDETVRLAKALVDRKQRRQYAHTMVFCNTSESAKWLWATLRKHMAEHLRNAGHTGAGDVTEGLVGAGQEGLVNEREIARMRRVRQQFEGTLAYDVADHVPFVLLTTSKLSARERRAVWKAFTQLPLDGVVNNSNVNSSSSSSSSSSSADGTKAVVMKKNMKEPVRLLVATDVVARGVDTLDVVRVINAELPRASDAFLHRVGRTGRLGRQGTVVSWVAKRDRAFASHLRVCLESGAEITPTTVAVHPEKLKLLAEKNFERA